MEDEFDTPEDISESTDPFLEEGDDAPKKIPVRNHLEPDIVDQCGYCGQHFGPDEIVIERVILGRTWKFCSEDCLRDFQDASDFRDQDLDGDDEPQANITQD